MFYPAYVNERSEQVFADTVDQDIINGKIYRAWDTSFNIAVDGSFNFAFVPSGYTWKVKIYLSSDASINSYAIEDASWNTNGTELSVVNFNRTSSNVCSVKVYAQPGDVNWSVGTLISLKRSFVDQSKTGSAASNYGYAADEYSFILAGDKLLLLSFQNKAGDVGFASLLFRITDKVI